MGKYIAIPFFQVGEAEPRLLLMLDGQYDTPEHYVRAEDFGILFIPAPDTVFVPNAGGLIVVESETLRYEPMPRPTLFDDETSV